MAWNHFTFIGEIHASTSQLEHRGLNITFNWVPSHIGVNGNEVADSIALEASIASCFEEMLFKFKQNWKHSVYNSDKSSVQRYLQINPLLKPFKSTLNQRYGEVLMSRLRCTDTSKCPFRCKVACDRCGNSFSTTHFRLECPGTPRLRSQIQELLSEDDFDLEPNEQVATALQAASQVA